MCCFTVKIIVFGDDNFREVLGDVGFLVGEMFISMCMSIWNGFDIN